MKLQVENDISGIFMLRLPEISLNHRKKKKLKNYNSFSISWTLYEVISGV